MKHHYIKLNYANKWKFGCIFTALFHILKIILHKYFNNASNLLGTNYWLFLCFSVITLIYDAIVEKKSLANKILPIR